VALHITLVNVISEALSQERGGLGAFLGSDKAVAWDPLSLLKENQHAKNAPRVQGHTLPGSRDDTGLCALCPATPLLGARISLLPDRCIQSRKDRTCRREVVKAI